MRTNRRAFIKYLLAAGAVPSAAAKTDHFDLIKKKEALRLTILHTNDTHSHIDPFPEDHPKYAGKGGVRKRMTIVQNIRNQGDEVLLLDAGDIFQGTPYFNVYRGELEFRVMSAMKYDAATMGNHDFDIGLDGFLNAFPLAEFPFVCSNYDFNNTPLKGKTAPFQIIRKGELKIGIVGLGVELNGLVSKSLHGETRYLDPITKAQETADILREELECNMIVVLSHLGYQYASDKIGDVDLAALTNNIDLIIGGHTHTFLPEPDVLKNKDGNPVLVNQVGWAGINLGRIDFIFYRKNNGLLSCTPVWEKNQIISV